MGKSDIAKRMETAKSFIDKLDDVAGSDEDLAEILNNLVDVLKPIGGKSQNYKKLCATVDGILEYSSGFASKTGTSEKQLEKKKKYLKAVVEFFKLFKCEVEYENDSSDYGPPTLITADEKDD